MDAWQASAWLAWIVSAVLFVILCADFFRINTTTDEDVLLSSRENFDELFANSKTEGG